MSDSMNPNTSHQLEPFVFRSGQKASTAEELIELCDSMHEDSIYYLLRQDFEKWLAYIGNEELSSFATQARVSSEVAEESLHRFIAECNNFFNKRVFYNNLADAELAQIQERARQRGFSFLLIGRTGVGKSSTINSLMGREVAPVGEFEAETKVVNAYTAPSSAIIPYIVYDTPGLCDADGNNEQYLKLIHSKIRNPIDCLWFVTQLDDSRVRSDEIDTIRHATNAFGKDIWKRAVIVFTRSDKVAAKDYARFLAKRSELVRNEISVHVGREISQQIPSVAVTNESPKTPDGKLWLGRLFVNTFTRISDEGLDGFLLEIVNWRGLRLDMDESGDSKHRPYYNETRIINKINVHQDPTANVNMDSRPAAIPISSDDMTPEFKKRAENWMTRVEDKIINTAKAGAHIGREVGCITDNISGGKWGREVGRIAGAVAGGTVGAVGGLLDEGGKAVSNAVGKAFNAIGSLFR
jgi:GTP-binding protein EngB required for normal cell division